MQAKEGIFRHDEYHSGVECYICSPLKPAVNTQICRYHIHLRKKVRNGATVLENSAFFVNLHSLLTFLCFDKDILGNEAATE